MSNGADDFPQPSSDNHEAGAAASFVMKWRGPVWQLHRHAACGLRIAEITWARRDNARCLRLANMKGQGFPLRCRKDSAMISDNDNGHSDEDSPAIFIILGQICKQKGGEMKPVHVMLAAADEDTAVRLCLDALSSKGYAEADLDQIGVMAGRPAEEPHASAYKGAIAGEVAVIAFD